jgi:SagB-type dehydrogenase family enzyme
MNRYSDLGATDRHDHGLYSPAEIYHENSKMRRAPDGYLIGSYHPSPLPSELQHALLHATKSYPCAPRVSLPQNLPPLNVTLDSALAARSSVRAYSGAPFSMEEVSRLLLLAYGFAGETPLDDGETTRPRRTAPSAGALYPVELYLVALRTQDLDAGVYHYQPKDHVLERLRTGDLQQEVEAAVLYPEAIERASIVVLMGAVFHRNSFKYGERGYRFTLLDAGHIGQNLYLGATALKLGAVAIGGFLDDAINRLVEMNGVDESVVYLMAFGHPLRGDEGLSSSVSWDSSPSSHSPFAAS